MATDMRWNKACTRSPSLATGEVKMTHDASSGGQKQRLLLRLDDWRSRYLTKCYNNVLKEGCCSVQGEERRRWQRH